MYTTIEIDFDVYKELTMRRTSPEMAENDVLRELLGVTPKKAKAATVQSGTVSGIPWVWKGVTFPHGTEFRAEYRGRKYDARAENGAMVFNGQSFKSPSTPAGEITQTSVNGWLFWECRMPGKTGWVPINSLRNKKAGK